jgi:SAM-dependent methyltransferase
VTNAIANLLVRVIRLGLPETLRLVWEKLPGKRISGWRSIAQLVANRKGIEIGGPSAFFARNGPLPLYGVAKTVDGCNFAERTLWEGDLKEGPHYRGGLGFQYIREGTDLYGVPDNSYDFVLSCNSLEHTANPVRALKEWHRVARPGGALIVVVPRKESTFDHRRPVTSAAHLLQDYEKSTSEKDLSHLEEVLSLHDLLLDSSAGDRRTFESRCRDNFANRCIHHHVFDLVNLREIYSFLSLSIVYTHARTADYVVVAKVTKTESEMAVG